MLQLAPYVRTSKITNLRSSARLDWPRPQLDGKVVSQQASLMKTTIDLPEGLVQQLKFLAVKERQPLINCRVHDAHGFGRVLHRAYMPSSQTEDGNALARAAQHARRQACRRCRRRLRQHFFR